MFTSYAQNYEDVMLNRVFSETAAGFYIDVGANDPMLHSVTKAFYDRGWSGINIEPVKQYFEKLTQDRPRDINLNIAAGEDEGTAEFFEVENTGLSTFDREAAEQLSQDGLYAVKPYSVKLSTLAKICADHVTQPIDFLKIDVEGWEAPVINGHDWTAYRPKIVIIEATIPGTPVRKTDNIAAFMKAQNYDRVYFDGMNDFWLAHEHSNWAHFFETPPNVFDRFNSQYTLSLRTQAETLRETIGKKNAEIKDLRERLHARNLRNLRLNEHIAKLSDQLK